MKPNAQRPVNAKFNFDQILKNHSLWFSFLPPNLIVNQKFNPATLPHFESSTDRSTSSVANYSTSQLSSRNSKAPPKLRRSCVSSKTLRTQHYGNSNRDFQYQGCRLTSFKALPAQVHSLSAISLYKVDMTRRQKFPPWTSRAKWYRIPPAFKGPLLTLPYSRASTHHSARAS